MKIKFGIFLLIGFFLFSLAFLIPHFFSQNNTVAEIYLDGTLIETIDLARVSTPYTIPVVHGDKKNIVFVEPGYISVSSASCPDQVCVNQGKISSGMVPIVCLPHRLVIELKEKNNSSHIISR